MSGARPQSSPGADRRGATQQRNRDLSPADEAALATALARKPEALLDELREAWEMPAGRPVRVVGRLTLTPREFGDLVFLNDFEHPETGVQLVYPKLLASSRSSPKPAFAFVPLGPSREVASNQAMATNEQWAIAEVELSSASERRKHQNPWRVDVRSGTLRLLSELPEEWHVQVHGAQSVRRISALARKEIEAYVRYSVLEEDQELARRHAENVRRQEELETTNREAEEEARTRFARLNEKLAAHQQRRDAARKEADDLQQRVAAELIFPRKSGRG